LEGTSPPEGAVVKAEPSAVIFEFDEPVEGNFGAVRVYDAAGERVDEGERGLPETEAESRDREDADEDRGELHVRRGPGPEQLDRPAVPFVERNELRPAGLDLEDLGAVAALPDKDARPGVAATEERNASRLNGASLEGDRDECTRTSTDAERPSFSRFDTLIVPTANA